MVASNEQLIIKIRGIADNLPKIIDQAGSMLVRNVRSQARIAMGNGSKFPFEFKNDFQKAETVTYQPAEQIVIVAHPAAKKLEYGYPATIITAKNEPYMTFRVEENEWVSVKEVKIGEIKPLGYVKKAIEETKKDLSKKFKEVING
jgi:hypothetical protein